MESDVGIKQDPHPISPQQPRTVRVLLLEDDEFDGLLILDALRKGGVAAETKRVVLRGEFLLALEDFKPDLVLSDHKLPDITGAAALAHVKENFPHIPFILVTGAIGEEAAVEAMKGGATDYILKDKLFRLVPAVNRALREASEARRRKEAEELLRLQHIRLKAQNEKLFESEQRFRQLAEHIREVFWMTDPEKRTMIYISPGYEVVWGRTCQSLYDSPGAWVEAIYPGDRDAVTTATLTKQASGDYDEVYRIVRPDGSIRWIHDRAFPVRDESGRVYRIAGIAEDITRRKLDEQALQQAEAKYRSIFENAVEGIFQASPQGRFLSANPALARILGYESPAELIASIGDIGQQLCVDAAKRLELKRRLDGDGYVRELESELRRRDGSKRWTSVNARVVRDGSGAVLYYEGTCQDITERKKMERLLEHKVEELVSAQEDLASQNQELVASRATLEFERGRYEELFSYAPDGYIVTDLRGIILDLNLAACRMLQQPRDFLVGVPLTGFFETTDQRKILELLPRVKKAAVEKTAGVEAAIRPRINGEPMSCALTVNTLTDATGAVVGLRWLARDITEQKRIEARIVILAQAVESTAEMICITDLQDRFTFVNRAFEKAYGYAPEEIIGKTPEMLFSSKNPPGLITEILSKTRSGGWRGEVLDRRKDGTDLSVFLSTSEIRDAAGKVIGLMGIAQDISERRRTEQQMRLLAHSVQSRSEMVSITDENNRITFVNKAFLDAYGYSEDEVLGRTPEFLYSPGNEPDLCHQIYGHTLKGGWGGELLNRTKTGKEFPVALSTSPIKNDMGAVLGLIGLAKDISERKRSEKQANAFSVLGHRLSSANTAEHAAEIIMDIASELFGWDSGYVHLYAEVEDCIMPVLTVDTVDGQRVPIPAETFTQDPSPLMRLVMKQGAQLINQAEESSVPVKLVPFGDRSRPSASKMYVPIRSAGDVLGVLAIQSYTPRAYSSGDLMLLQALADHCGGALARISAADALRKAEAKYRSIFEHATEGIFQTTPDGRYLSANPALARMFGYASPAELISSITNIERQTFVSAENAGELKQKLSTNSSIMGFEAERYRKDGTRFWTSINVRAIRDSGGAVLYYEGTVQDITKRKSAESVLRESERKLRLIAENTEDVIFSFDMSRRPVYVNPAVEKLTGYTFAEILERKFINWIHPGDQERMLNLWEELYAGKGYAEVEFRLITKHGKTKWCSSTWGPLFDEAGRQVGVQGLERDITERKYLERELIESTNNERRRVGHELHDGLGQHLAGVALKAKALEHSLIAENVPHAAEARELATLVSNAINQTRRIARGLDPIEVETIGLPAALENLVEEIRKVFNVGCALKCSDGTGTFAPEAALALYRIIQESIHNAITHGASKSIEVDLSVAANEVTVRIKDDGIGFDPDSVKQAGMGLRVMQYRARSLGGRVSIRSRTGQGTEIVCSVLRSLCMGR